MGTQIQPPQALHSIRTSSWCLTLPSVGMVKLLRVRGGNQHVVQLAVAPSVPRWWSRTYASGRVLSDRAGARVRFQYRRHVAFMVKRHGLPLFLSRTGPLWPLMT